MSTLENKWRRHFLDIYGYLIEQLARVQYGHSGDHTSFFYICVMVASDSFPAVAVSRSSVNTVQIYHCQYYFGCECIDAVIV